MGVPATRHTAIDAIRPGGVIMHIGLLDGGGELDMRQITLSEVTLIATYTYTAVDVRAAAMLHRGALAPLIWLDERPIALRP